jgi:RNA polymerase sigma factor (sigma-70 family)
LSGRDLKRLFLAHRRELHAYVAERLRDREIASDLTQDAFVRFAEQGDQAVVVHDRSYLYRTVQNLATDHLRRIDRQKTDVTAYEDLADLPEGLPSPEDIVCARERLDQLRAAIQELPLRTRQVFILTRIEELTYNAAAIRLGISESSVQKHLATALQHVMQRIKPR